MSPKSPTAASHHKAKGATRIPSRIEHLKYRAVQTLVYPLIDWRRRLFASGSQRTINQKEIRVIGLRRTGNHAVINWIISQQAGKSFHINNVAVGTNPYRQKSDNLRRYHPEHIKMANVYRRQAVGNLIERDCLIHSYEDWSLQQIAQPQFERNLSLYLGRSAQRLDVLILRDPFNLFASRLKQGFVATRASGATMVDLWLAYAKAFIGENHPLQNPIFVNYNRWFTEKAYRQKLAAQLGLTFSDAGLEQVTAFGGGSSFEGTRVSGQSLDVTNRWRAFANDPAFQHLFNNEAVWDYSERIFGHIPGTDSLRHSQSSTAQRQAQKSTPRFSSTPRSA